MAWRIGIDEAGYGPNLGPLVMTAVACRVPDDLAEADLWQTLAAAVRRERPAGRRERFSADNRLLVNDSKLVYSAAQGLADLETTVLSFLSAAEFPCSRAGDMVSHLCPAEHQELAREIWYHGQTGVPTACPHTAILSGAKLLRQACAAQGVQWGPVRTAVVCPGRFNDLVDHWDSKAAVLAISMADLFRRHLDQNGTEPLCIVVDKHGGRNHYSALVQEAVGAGMTLAREESAARSVYEVTGLDHPMRVTFMPRADGADMCVALASMISKYLRELFMAEFNEFWLKLVPGLAPTAGYPGDAGRFFADIEPVRRRLKVADRQLWRQR